MTDDFITPEEARLQLGDDAFWSFRRWLSNHGYINLTPVSDTKLVNKVFATRSQLEEFLSEVTKEFKGKSSAKELLGQTREYFNGVKVKKK